MKISDITFITPVKIDSEERINNLDFCVNYITQRLKAPHIVIEQDIFNNVPNVIKANGYEYLHIKDDAGYFYKTRLINTAMARVRTPLVCIYDADVYILEGSFAAAVKQLTENSDIHFIIPHTGIFYDIPNFFSLDYNFRVDKLAPRDLTKLHDNSPGGAFLARNNTLLQIGGYNENMKSWGYEDDEIIARAAIYGYPVVRPKVHFHCYHFHHYRGVNSSSCNPYCRDNLAELERIKKMTHKELLSHKIS